MLLRSSLWVIWRSFRGRIRSQPSLTITSCTLAGVLVLFMGTVYGVVDRLLARYAAATAVNSPVIDLLISESIVLLSVFLISSALPIVYSTFLSAADRELYLYVPQSFLSLFVRLFCLSLLRIGWFVVPLSLPFCASIAAHTPVSWLFAAGAAASLLCLVTTVVALSTAAVLIIFRFIPVDAIRRFGLTIVSITVLVSIAPILVWSRTPSQVMKAHSAPVAAAYFLPENRPFLLPSLFSSVIVNGLSGDSLQFVVALLGALGVTAGALGLAYLLFDRLYLAVIERVTTHRAKRAVRPVSRLWSPLRSLKRIVGSQFWAIASKETSLVLRDSNHAFHAIGLLVLVGIYLLNFGELTGIVGAQLKSRAAASIFLSILNFVFVGEVVAALCTRFVYPSLSLEGRAVSVLALSPLGVDRLVNLKFLYWCGVVVFVGVVLLCSGALAADATPPVIAYSLLLGIPLCAGLAATAMGLGAFTARFDWQHPSQIASGVGALLFFAVATVLVVVASIPSALGVAALGMWASDPVVPSAAALVIAGFCLLLTFVVFTVAGMWAIRGGSQALAQRIEML